MRKSIYTFCILFFSLKGIVTFSQLNPLSVGTIPSGDSIIIYYDVTVNTPIPVGVTQISNQGTVSGSNFSNLLTDDPDSGPAGDATITVLNMFPLPVFLTELKAAQRGNGVEVSWKVVTETDIDKYEIERSADGSNFIKIGETAALNNPSGTADYRWLDVQPLAGSNYYRLRVIERGQHSRYSGIVRVNTGAGSTGIQFFPNPVNNKSITLQMQNIEKGIYQLQIVDITGRVIMNKIINHAGGSASQLISLPAGISSGAYWLRLLGEIQPYSQLIKVN